MWARCGHGVGGEQFVGVACGGWAWDTVDGVADGCGGMASSRWPYCIPPQDKGEALFTTAELKEIFGRSGLPLTRGSFIEFVEDLNMKNYILKRGVGIYKLQTVGLSMHGTQR